MQMQLMNPKEVVLSNCHGESFVAVLSSDDDMWHIFVPCKQIEDNTGWKWIDKASHFGPILGIVYDYNMALEA